ncbi:hypothetical protein ABVK25_009801 [Lepraria finkii]|uniref:Uncharacterized protein n=1 Tax=Lepraria finkii TaxID=1340010 RepID=A0ABR4AW82_9LECA
MAFGFAISDFIAVGELALKLYRDCYMVARGAPQEFQLLLGEVSTLRNSLTILQDEVKNPDSTLVRAGENRMRMVNGMIAGITDTLKRLEKLASKYEILGSNSRRKQLWAKLKWSTEFSGIDALRNKLIYHNAVMNLLLTSVGNSSLQRIESSHAALEEDVKAIRSYIMSSQRNEKPQVPSLSAVDDEILKISLHAAFMRNAEVSQSWNTIGLDQWIDAGRWWLLRSQMELYNILTPKQSVPLGAYINLIKASWIVVDIIACHPQVSLIAASKYAEVQLLSAELKNQFSRLESLDSVFPDLGGLEGQDLRIWETPNKGLIIRPRNSLRTPDGGAVVGGEQILFQRFAICKLRALAEALPSILLLLVRQDTKDARLVAQDQNGSILMAVALKGLAYSHRDASNSVKFNDEQVTFTNALDPYDLCTLLEAINTYSFERTEEGAKLDDLIAYILLVAMKNEAQGVVRRILPQLSEKYNTKANGKQGGALQIATSLASEFTKLKVAKRHCSIFGRPWHKTALICWVVECGHTSLLKVLLKEHHNISRVGGLSIVGIASRCGNEELTQMLLDCGFEVQEQHEAGNFPLHEAAIGRNDKIVKLLLERGARVEATNDKKETALHIAVREGMENIVRQLIKNGAKCGALDNKGSNPLDLAAEAGHVRIVRLLLANEWAREPNYFSVGMAFYRAAELRRLEIVKEFVDWCGNINCLFCVAVENAIIKGDEVVLAVLIDAAISKIGKFPWGKDLTSSILLSNLSEPAVHTILALNYASQPDSQWALRRAADRGHQGAKVLLDGKGDDEADKRDHSTYFALKAIIAQFYASQPAFNLTIMDADVQTAEVRIELTSHGTYTTVWLDSYHAYIKVPSDFPSDVHEFYKKGLGFRPSDFTYAELDPSAEPEAFAFMFTFAVVHQEASLDFSIETWNAYAKLQIVGGGARTVKREPGKFFHQIKAIELPTSRQTEQAASTMSFESLRVADGDLKVSESVQATG